MAWLHGMAVCSSEDSNYSYWTEWVRASCYKDHRAKVWITCYVQVYLDIGSSIKNLNSACDRKIWSDRFALTKTWWARQQPFFPTCCVASFFGPDLTFGQGSVAIGMTPCTHLLWHKFRCCFKLLEFTQEFANLPQNPLINKLLSVSHQTLRWDLASWILRRWVKLAMKRSVRLRCPWPNKRPQTRKIQRRPRILRKKMKCSVRMNQNPLSSVLLRGGYHTARNIGSWPCCHLLNPPIIFQLSYL